MKSLAKQLALVVFSLSLLQIIIAGLIREGFLAETISNYEWLESSSRFILFPDPTITLSVLVVSFCVWAILFWLGQRTRKAPFSPPSRPPQESFRQLVSLRKNQESKPGRPPKSCTTTHHDRVKVEDKWRRLEEADKEAIRAIVSQGGLWETDIVALLETRGFLHPKATLASLAERVSFIDCDYAGYHSIHPEYHAQLVSVLDTDNAEDSL